MPWAASSARSPSRAATTSRARSSTTTAATRSSPRAASTRGWSWIRSPRTAPTPCRTPRRASTATTWAPRWAARSSRTSSTSSPRPRRCSRTAAATTSSAPASASGRAGPPGPEQLRQAHVGGHQPPALQRLRSPHPHEGRGHARRVRRRRRQRQHAGGRGRRRQQRPRLRGPAVAGRRHRGLRALQLDHRLPARRLLPRQLRGHRRQHEPDLRVRSVVGGAGGGASPVPAAGRLLEPPARAGERPRPHDAQVRQPGADHAFCRRPAPTASSSAGAGRTLHERRRARVPQPGLRHRLLGPELHQPGHRPDRARAPTATTRSTTRGRSARRAPTSSTCSCRTPGGSPRG